MMKLPAHLTLALVAALATAAGCSSEEEPSSPDAGAKTDSGVTPPPDAGVLPPTDAGAPDSGAMVVEEDLTFAPTSTAAFGTLDEMDGTRVNVLYAWDGDFYLTMEIYEGFGGPVGPGTVALGADESSYDTCGTCLILETDCTAEQDGVFCDTAFMPRPEGSVRFTSLSTAAGSLMAGEVRDVVFREVTIDPDTYEATTVQGGRVVRLAPWSFSAEVVTPE
jgi:hypothetical protein